MNFEFAHKKDRFIWGNDQVRIVFSNPNYQAFREYSYVKDVKEIMHYYYSVEIYENRNGKGFKLLTGRNTYDFPCIVDLLDMLDTMLHTKIKREHCRKIVYKTRDHDGKIVDSGRVGYEYTISSEGFAYDDFYMLKKTEIEDSDKVYESFTLFMGCSPDIQGNRTSIGFMTEHVDRKDLEKLYDCVNSFIQYTIKNENTKLVRYCKNYIACLKTDSIKLYHRNDKSVNDVYPVGTNCDIVRLVGSLDSTTFTSEDYRQTTIVAIKKNSIVVKDGYIDKRRECEKIEKECEIPLSEILYIADNSYDTELRYYGVDEIVQDWIKLLNDKEKEEFKRETVDALFDKWSEAIINRTNMCIPDHNLPVLAQPTEEDYHANVKANVKVVIEKVKELL